MLTMSTLRDTHCSVAISACCRSWLLCMLYEDKHCAWTQFLTVLRLLCTAHRHCLSQIKCTAQIECAEAAVAIAKIEVAKTAVAIAEHNLKLAREDAISAMNTITELSHDVYEQQQRAEAAEEQLQNLEVTVTELQQQVTRKLAVVEVAQDSANALRGVLSEAIAELDMISDTADDVDTTKALLTIL
jgi:chromosome segregation ATPase